ncbi:helicase swr1 [Massariosphaeria phaeospora]|uniref:DNA helicase n=1 Tax=Massariosphaeria phaeospora TaxID=100035 RepID=A0A7C8I9T8_9PLEO|nr:helicase swr1 [Massariosphaeria phaeospora]
MEQVTLVNRDADPNPPPHNDAAIAPNESAAAHDDAALVLDNVPAIASEDEHATENEEDGSGTQRPAKRRRLDNFTPRPSASRAPSPPWKSFAADGPTTVFDNGVRKSSRVSKDAPPPPPPGPSKRSSRHATKATQTNGAPKNGMRQNGSRTVSSSAASSKGKTTHAVAKKASIASLQSPSRKSERQRKASTTTAVPPSPLPKLNSPESVRRRPGRPRKSTQVSIDQTVDSHIAPVSYYGNGYDASSDVYNPLDDANASGPAPRLRLRLRKPDPPNRHPQHTAAPPNFPTFTDWLQSDDPLEGEEGQRVTQEKAQEEAQRRLKIVDAAEHGALSEAQCSVFAPEPAEEPPPRYRHWDHIVTHALHFNKLLKAENAEHKRRAKLVAREALEYWKNKYKRKTQDEIEQDEADRAMLRYKQLVKDLKDSWSNVKIEIDKERVAKWEEEQLQLGHKAMDDMFNQAQEILGRNAVDSASSLVSDDRESEGDEEDFRSVGSHASRIEDQDANMSSSSDSDGDHDNDEDANLTAEQLRAKYEQLPDLPSEKSGSGEDSEDSEEDERTPEPGLDPDIEMEGHSNLPEDPFAQANGFHDDEMGEDEQKPEYIDPATVELDQIDDALLDSEENDSKASQSGSEEWPSDGESEEVEQSDSDSEEGEDIGVMGFLGASEIEKIKQSAKSEMEHRLADPPAPTTNGVNGHEHHSEAGDDTEMPELNGESLAPFEDRSHVNGDSVPAELATSIEARESEPDESIYPEKIDSRNRSRHGSAPAHTEIPSLLRGTLREYQHDGLDWLANLYDSDTNGILADEMGLGKTIQTISLLAYIAVYRQKWGPHLVVVPTSVILNWEMEFKKWCPGFKILTYYGDINERKRKRTGWRTTGRDMYNVVITSYQLILQDAAAFKMRAWQYLVLDEAHNIKNFKSQRWQTMLTLRTERRLLLTGTPLQNNLDELWSLLYFLMPAGFAGEGRIAGLEEFTMALKNPTSQILDQGRQQLDVEAQKIVRKLHEVLRPYLLRRLKADVEKQMPGKYEHVVYCKLSKRQRQLYDGFMGRASTKEILSSGNYMSIINCLMSLRKVCNHPDLFETRAIVTSMAMPKSVAAEYEIKDLFIRKRLHEGIESSRVNMDALNLVFVRQEQTSKLHARRARQIRATRPLEDLIERQTRRIKQTTDSGTSSVQSALSAMANRENTAVRNHLQLCLNLTRARTQFLPIYGKSLIELLTMSYEDYIFGAQEDMEEEPEKNTSKLRLPSFHVAPFHSTLPFAPRSLRPMRTDPISPLQMGKRGVLGFRGPRTPGLASTWCQNQISIFQPMVPTLEQRAESLETIITKFTCVTPAVAAEEIAPLTLSRPVVNLIRASTVAQNRDAFHESRLRQSIAFPDKRLLQYDCGKLQRLAVLLRDLQAGGHRALIFTQMTKVLDLLEQFLNIHGHRYLRLDGATKVESRQILTDRFNNDPRILCFILSSRSGGLGINLTGADTVIFYDLDWNPAMDKQCQDRSHRIGQTRDVHIYKFVSEYTIEANILRKSNQKRLLDDVIIQKGDFTTDTFNKMTYRDALDDGAAVAVGDEAGAAMDRVLGEKAGLLGDARVMGTVEDTEDRTAASIAQKEIVDEIHDDQVDFSESSAATPANAASAASRAAGDEVEEEDAAFDEERRHVDEYMLEWYREEHGKEPYRPPTDRQKRNRKGQDVHRTSRKKKY